MAWPICTRVPPTHDENISTSHPPQDPQLAKRFKDTGAAPDLEHRENVKQWYLCFFNCFTVVYGPTRHFDIFLSAS